MFIDLEKIRQVKSRLIKTRAVFNTLFGINAARLSSYPSIGTILHNGQCMSCFEIDKLIHFDSDLKLCELCAENYGLDDLI